MDIERWPKSIRWLLFLPVAVVASVVAHFALTVGLAGTGDHISLLGIDIEGPSARRIALIWREGLMRFLEPWAFVAAAGVIAPARRAPSVATAGAITLLLIGVLGAQVIGMGRAELPAALRAAIGIGGAIAGAVTAIRSKPRDESVPDEFLELLSKLD